MAEKKRSIAGVVRHAKNMDKQIRKALVPGKLPTKAKDAAAQSVVDSFVNFQQLMGVGADSPLTTAGYGFNPVTRNRTMLEWIYRGSWLGGIAIDCVAQDMTRAGVDIIGNLKPNQQEQINEAIDTLGIWTKLQETVAWARLYGGCIAVMLVDGQNYSTPLNTDRVGKGQFKGLLVLDRWMIEPSFNDLVVDAGPYQGKPKYYTVIADAPAMPRVKIHYSRVIRMEGISLPYWQAITENGWGISVLERLYDRMIAYDSATTGAAQLVYKAYIRTYKIQNLRDVIATGGKALDGLIQFVEMMRRYQGNEGITLIDGEDEFEGVATNAFSGLSDALSQFGQQIAGALQIPLMRLFGQSPSGFNSGDTDLRMYYDGIRQQQQQYLKIPIGQIYRMTAASEGIVLPTGTSIEFRSLWQLTDKEKGEAARDVSDAVTRAFDASIISQRTALLELRQSSRTTGVFSNITDEDIEAADDEPPPSATEAMGNGLGLPGAEGEGGNPGEPADPNIKKKKAEDSAIGAVGVLKRMFDINVAIENPKGSIRSSNTLTNPWEVVMPAHYGYVLRTTGADGDQVDCFIGPNPKSASVYIIQQKDLKTGLYDEDKCMLGYNDFVGAMKDYVDAYSDGHGMERIQGFIETNIDGFKQYLSKGVDK